MHLFHSSEVLPHLPLHLLFQVLPAGQQEEQRYYEEIIGLKGTFLFADTPQEARLKIISGQGYMPVDVIGEQVWFDSAVNRTLF